MKSRILFFLLVISVTFQFHQAAFSQSRDDLKAQNYYLKGTFLEEWNELDYAYTFYKAAEEKCPESMWLKLALTRVSLNIGKFDEAKEYAKFLLGNEEYNVEASIYLSEANVRTGEKRKAAENLEAIEEDLDKRRRKSVLNFLARIYFDLEDENNIRKTLEKLKKTFPDDIFANNRLGLFYAKEGKTEKALESFRIVLSQDPAYQDLPQLMSSLLISEGRREEAKRVLEKAFNANPADKEVSGELFRMINEDKEFSRGIDILKPLFDSEKLGVGDLIRLGRFYFNKGEFEEALVVYRKLMDKDCNKTAVFRIIADLELKLNNFRNAAERLEKLVEMEPNDFSSYRGLLFLAHDLAGSPSSPQQEVIISSSDSARYVNKAKKLVNRDSAGQNYIMGIIYNEAGKNEIALDYLLRAEKLKPGDRDITLELAQVFEEKGSYDKALHRVKKLYKKNPKDPTLMNYYGYLLAVSGNRLDFAEELLGKVLKHDPGNGYYLDSLGWIKFKKGEYSDALKILLDAADSIADDPTIWEHIGDTYVRLEAIEKAEKAYRKSVELNPGRQKVMEKLHAISAEKLKKQ
ncbi:MAG: tetratricopeptide repeat protein [Candidatus Krumholzibacteriota bacterium]|nr:tetratricopeptide repeat protein [Candidatus Krumholzibacteriota bacterium]